MATSTINDYTAAVSIDASNDYLLLEQSSVYKKINRSVLLGISGSPVGTSDSQTLTNKVLDNTNTLTVKDSLFTLQNASDVTKQVNFSLAGITTGNTRTLTLPDSSSTLATLSGTETLTNKTITAPAISGGTIDNTTITVDSISGHTSSTVVTVAGVQLNNGVISTANAVTATSIAAGAVQPQALTTGTGTGWAWSSWTPTLANLTLGNGVVSATYIQTGKMVKLRMKFTFGSTSVITGIPTFSLPVTATAGYTGSGSMGSVIFLNTGVAGYFGYPELTSTTVMTMFTLNVSATYPTVVGWTNAIPFAFVNGSILYVEATYEAS